MKTYADGIKACIAALRDRASTDCGEAQKIRISGERTWRASHLEAHACLLGEVAAEIEATLLADAEAEAAEPTLGVPQNFDNRGQGWEAERPTPAKAAEQAVKP